MKRIYVRPEVEPQTEGAPAKRKTVQVRADRWQQAESLAAPTRKNLTKRQWQERGDLIKIVKVEGFTNAEECSLEELRDVRESILRCQLMRMQYNRKAALLG